MQISVYPIDKNGFVLWTSDRYRFEDESYEPLADEVIVPIPNDVTWFQPRWDGKAWVEGKDHPGLPVIPPDPDFPEEQLPEDGIFAILGIKSVDEMVDYLEDFEVKRETVVENADHLADVRVIPVLIAYIQELQQRVEALESKI